MAHRLIQIILDTLFPLTCLSCRQEGLLLCDQCLAKIPFQLEQHCPICEHHSTPAGRTCLACCTRSSLDGMLVATSYQSRIISHAIHCFKYRFAESLHEPLGKILVNALSHSELTLPDLILPVPLHPRRLRWRGFNQSWLLAQYLAEHLTPGFSISTTESSLIRQRYTHPQAQVKKHAARAQNIRGAFQVPKESRPEIAGKNILLVDDVATTGATIFECAKALKKSGAKSVFALVIARQSFKTDKH